MSFLPGRKLGTLPAEMMVPSGVISDLIRRFSAAQRGLWRYPVFSRKIVKNVILARQKTGYFACGNDGSIRSYFRSDTSFQRRPARPLEVPRIQSQNREECHSCQAENWVLCLRK